MTTLAVLRWIGWRGALALSLLAMLCVQTVRLTTAERDLARDGKRAAEGVAATARAVLAESEASRAWEQERAGSVNRISDAFERGKLYAQDLEARTVADLRAGNVRLRELWQGCKARPAAVASTAPADPGEPDATDGLREASAGRIVRIVATCQAERDALLKVAEDDRAP